MYMPRMSRRTRRRRGGGFGDWFTSLKNKISGNTASAAPAPSTGLFGAPAAPAPASGMFDAPAAPAPTYGGRRRSRSSRRRRRGGSKCSSRFG